MTFTVQDPGKKMERLAERKVRQVLIYASEDDVRRWDEVATQRRMTRNAWLLQTIEGAERKDSARESDRADLVKQIEDEKRLRQEYQDRATKAELQVLQLTRDAYSMQQQIERLEQEVEDQHATIKEFEENEPPVDAGAVVRQQQAAARGLARTVAEIRKRDAKKSKRAK